MDEFKKDFINIIKAAFSEKAGDISPDFDWEKAVSVAKKHNIVPIIYYGAIACKVPNGLACMEQLHQLTLKSMMISLRQLYEIEQIEKAFEAENISYMPLKGIILKNIYPKPEMRTMGDADILIQLEQYPTIKSIMERLQFSFQYESDHELVWKKPTLFLELHKRIMTSYNKDFYRYFGTGWQVAKKVSDRSRYEMSAEDFYIFSFVHFTKHYRISGIGIKHLIDLWVYSCTNSNLNWGYIEKALKKLNLLEFHANVRKTIDVWFNDGEKTDITDLITNVIFNSGEYGTTEMTIINRALRNGEDTALKIKVSHVFHSVFLPYSAMKKKYSILEKAPILLPIMWLVRCCNILFCDKKRVKHYFGRINQIDTSRVEDNRHALHAVGLDFNNNE